MALVSLLSTFTHTQLKSGPMPGHTDFRTAAVWVECKKSIDNACARYRVKTALTPASFVLWSGNNRYTREVNYYSDQGFYNELSLPIV